MQEPKAGRRIVSRGEYVKAQGKRARIFLRGVVLVLFAFGLYCMAFFLGMGEVKYFRSLVGVLIGVLLAIWGIALAKRSREVITQAIQLDPGVPLTRANAADLPAPDSLVRASQEPMQIQESVLLRAASGEAQAEPEAQLLRASVGGQE